MLHFFFLFVHYDLSLFQVRDDKGGGGGGGLGSGSFGSGIWDGSDG